MEELIKDRQKTVYFWKINNGIFMEMQQAPERGNGRASAVLLFMLWGYYL